MQSYELTLVLSEKVSSAKKKTISALVEKIATTHKGKVAKTEDWGLIKLAYKIAKNESGNFLHFNLELDPAGVKTLEDNMRREESVIRHLLVKKEKTKGAASA